MFVYFSVEGMLIAMRASTNLKQDTLRSADAKPLVPITTTEDGEEKQRRYSRQQKEYFLSLLGTGKSNEPGPETNISSDNYYSRTGDRSGRNYMRTVSTTSSDSAGCKPERGRAYISDTE